MRLHVARYKAEYIRAKERDQEYRVRKIIFLCTNFRNLYRFVLDLKPQPECTIGHVFVILYTTACFRSTAINKSNYRHTVLQLRQPK